MVNDIVTRVRKEGKMYGGTLHVCALSFRPGPNLMITHIACLFSSVNLPSDPSVLQEVYLPGDSGKTKTSNITLKKILKSCNQDQPSRLHRYAAQRRTVVSAAVKIYDLGIYGWEFHQVDFASGYLLYVSQVHWVFQKTICYVPKHCLLSFCSQFLSRVQQAERPAPMFPFAY